jgi:hypothetical protein
MTSEVLITESKLYDQDYSLWLQQTIFYLTSF